MVLEIGRLTMNSAVSAIVEVMKRQTEVLMETSHVLMLIAEHGFPLVF